MTDCRRYREQAFRTRAGRLLFLAVLAFGGTTHAELYKWTDGQGKVHYADQPPATGAETLRGVPASQAETVREATETLNARDQAYRKRLKDAEDARAKADKEAEQAKSRQENCAKARSNLATLQNKSRVYRTNAAGQRVSMDDSARAEAIADSRKAITESCK